MVKRKRKSVPITTIDPEVLDLTISPKKDPEVLDLTNSPKKRRVIIDEIDISSSEEGDNVGDRNNLDNDVED